MGGNALKNTFTRRYLQEEYFLLEREVCQIFKDSFPTSKITAIPAYRTKESFGDMDILFEFDSKVDMKEFIINTFNTKELVQNSNCISFEYKEFQIDLITVKSCDYQSNLAYYSWNDLGGMFTVIAHYLGFKYSNNGLYFKFQENNYLFAEKLVSKDINQILKFLGYDPKIWNNGFDTLEDIYKFASSTRFFNRSIFALENRSHSARASNKKRTTYIGFLKWLDENENLPHYDWSNSDKYQFIERAFEFFPEFKMVYDNTMLDFSNWKKFKMLFNGRIVSEVTGLQNKELGRFMKHLKDTQSEEFENWVINQPSDVIVEWIKSQYLNFLVDSSS